MRMTGITGRVALVTGAAGGIGQAVVRLLREEGAIVVATDREAGAGIEALDVRDSHAVEALVERAENEHGPIDIGVNVAGIVQWSEVTETDDETWRDVFAVNADGVFNVSRALARRMKPRKRGVMVTVGSNAAGVPRHSMAAYAASKAAATMFTRCLGIELAPHGIRCNIVSPGSTLTPMQTGMWTDENGAERVIAGSLELYKCGIPLQKLAVPEDIANSVMFLISDQSSHITMTELYVDGGATLRA